MLYIVRASVIKVMVELFLREFKKVSTGWVGGFYLCCIAFCLVWLVLGLLAKFF